MSVFVKSFSLTRQEIQPCSSITRRCLESCENHFNILSDLTESNVRQVFRLWDKAGGRSNHKSSTRILLREELENRKFLQRHLMTYFRWRNLYNVIKMTSYVTFWSFTVL